MKSDSIDEILTRAPLSLWQGVFSRLQDFLAAEPWLILKNHHFIGLPSQGEMFWLQVLGSGGEAPGLNIHRGTAGLAALLRILSGSAESDHEAQVLMRSLDCLSLSFEGKQQLDSIDQALIDATGVVASDRRSFPQIRDCQAGWYPWYPEGTQLEQAIFAIEALLLNLQAIGQRPELLEPEDDNVAGVLLQGPTGEWQTELQSLPDFDVLDQVPAEFKRLDGHTLKKIEDMVARLPKGGPRLELGCIVLANASDPGDGGRPFFPQVLACVEAKSHALLAHKVLSPEELTPAAWRDCLMEGIEVIGQRPDHIDTDDLSAGAVVYSISDLLGCVHHPESRLKALSTVAQAMDRLL